LSDEELVFVLWCRLTGTDPREYGVEELEAFLARPQVKELARTPYPVLLDAGVTAARRSSLPLERWLGAVRTVRAGGTPRSADG
jgi:hypothetical protein